LEIVARPFAKFFNHSEPCAPVLDVRARAWVTDKLDGSLGILYPVNGGHAIATRGSFDSEQAQHATEVWLGRYADVPVPPGWTLLFEIIYPDNRIVCDYGDMDDLVLLGAVEIGTGKYAAPDSGLVADWPGLRAEVFDYRTLADALAAEPRPNAEGLVVYLPDTGERVKLKQEDYVALHRIVTGLNERTVWEHLRSGAPLDDLLTSLPEEFHGWVREVAARLLATVERSCGEVEAAYSTILASLPAEHTRKDFALIAAKHPLRGQLFARLDGKDYRPSLWEAAKPAANLGPRGELPDPDDEDPDA
jgi:RNA ligase